jgi:serine/threonine protein kinase
MHAAVRGGRSDVANETARGGATEETVPADSINLCREFESQWSGGQRPEIRDFLQMAPEASRDDLLSDLLEIEFNARRRNRELLGLDEYRKRFPYQVAIVERQYNQFVKPHELEDYEILCLVGRGGMGVVYKARQVRLNRIVALKVLSERLLDDPQAVNRFEREMQLNGQLSHHNIVNALDARKERGIYFLVTEFVEGVCLSDVIKSHPRIPVNDACEIVRQVADGLEYARRRDVVHRDIKPSNLMLTPGGTIKILDFGLAKLQADHIEQEIHRDLSVPGKPFGTFDYTAPEQCKDPTTVDHRADIYSLGCTMYHLLVGQPPFGGPQFSSVFAKMTAHSSTPPPRLDQFRDDVPPDVVAIIERMMAKQRDERFATPGDVAAALLPLAAGANLSNLLTDPGKTVTDAPTSAPGTTIKDAHAETKKASSSAAVAAHQSALRTAVAQIKRKPRIAAAVSAAVLLVAMAAILYLRPRPDSSGIPVADAIATLPGLDGNDDFNWWFNEIPWLVPQSRQRLVKWACEHDAADKGKFKELNETVSGAATTRLTKTLKRLATNLPGAGPDDADSDFFGKLAGRLADDPRTPGEFANQMQGIERLLFRRAGQPVPKSGSGVAAATEKLTAADCHLLAVVWHKRATLAPTGNRAQGNELTQDQLFELAEAAYQTAVEKYRREQDHQMATLCRSDQATMYYDRGRHEDLVDAQRDFRNIGADERIAPLARIYALCRQATISARLKQDGEAQTALRDAEKIATDRLPPDHPMRAFIAEWAGWTAMDALEYKPAKEYFDTAWALRKRIGQEKSEVAIHDKHGLALALQYAAIFPTSEASTQRAEQLKQSHEAFGQVIGDLSTFLNDKSPAYAGLSSQKLLNLCERMRNALDRDADGYLFGDQKYEIAATGYRKCLEFLDAHDDLAEGAKALEATQTRYKLTIALCCSKTTDIKDVRAELDQADKSFSRLLEGQKDRLGFLNAIAQGLCTWKESGPNARDRIVQALARPYAKNIKDLGFERCQLLLRDERLPLDLLLSVTNDQALTGDAIKGARKIIAGDRIPSDDGAAKAQSD